MPRSYLLYLQDMRQAIKRIARYCAGLDCAGSGANESTVDGVVRNLEVMGEAAEKAPTDAQQRCSQLPWLPPYRRRSPISHEYFGLGLATGWPPLTCRRTAPRQGS